MPSEAERLRTLARAVELSGGPERVAAHLGISVVELTSMLQGAVAVPENSFLQLVDLLTSHVQSADAVNAELNWLTVEAFRRLTPAQKATYLRQLADQLDVDLAQRGGGNGTRL